MLTPEQIANEFGPAWCEPAHFYAYEKALRFELAIGNHPIDRVLSAHQRASTVLQDAFRDVRELHVAFVIFFESERPDVRSLLSTFRELRECGLPQPVRGAMETSLVPGENDVWQCKMVAPLRQTELSRALWAAVVSDYYSVKPRISADVYLLSRDIGILAHPYDDRGMDLIGPNTARLKQIDDAYRPWLLDDNLDAMDQSFGRPNAASKGTQA